MTARQQRRHANCLDCGTPVSGNFCSNCGQENSDYRVSLKRLLGDLFEELFQLESRLWRSLYHLFRHPGQLTLDYNAGRRVRYTSPLRLYIIASVAYFFALTILPQSKSDLQIQFDDPEISELQSQSTDAFDRRIKEHLGFRKGGDMRAVQQRARDLLNLNAPRVMAVLVPLFALLTMLFFRRPSRFFVEHLVFALHLHAVAFWLLLLGELTRYEHASAIALLPTTIWLLLASRVVFAQSWWATIVKTLSVATIYSVLVVCGILVALLI
jgi:Protein of unknown function (DUF3667)